MGDQNKDSIDEMKHVHKSIATAKEDEKTKLEKAVGVFISEDFDTIKGSIVDEYIKPRSKAFVTDLIRKTKEMIVDSIYQAARIIFLDDGKKKTTEYKGQKVNYYSYDSGYPYETYSSGYSGYYGKVDEAKPSMSGKLRRFYITDENGNPSYRKAEEVLTDLLSLSKRYPSVCVADYYQLIGMENIITKQDYLIGWYKDALEGTEVVYTTKGYMLSLPSPVSLK